MFLDNTVCHDLDMQVLQDQTGGCKLPRLIESASYLQVFISKPHFSMYTLPVQTGVGGAQCEREFGLGNAVNGVSDITHSSESAYNAKWRCTFDLRFEHLRHCVESH